MLTLLLVLAATPITHSGTLQGWSADGNSLVWTSRETSSSPAHHYFEKSGKKAEVPMEKVMAMSESDRNKLNHVLPTPPPPPDENGMDGEQDPGEFQIDEDATVAVVRDVKTGTEVKYLTSFATRTPQAKGELKKRLAGSLDAAAYAAWSKTNGTVLKKGFEGPGGSKATVLIGGQKQLSWSVTDSMTVSYVVTRGADKSVVTMQDEMEAMYTPERSAEVFWDPTGRRALFAINTAEAHTMRGGVSASTMYFVVPAPPRVEVLASTRLKEEADRVAAVVEKTGFAVVTMGPATKDRPATVIYAGPAHQEAAQKIAAALPGATVDKLTWKANGEIVVAVGAPAK
jgi:hypothetical protein